MAVHTETSPELEIPEIKTFAQFNFEPVPRIEVCVSSINSQATVGQMYRDKLKAELDLLDHLLENLLGGVHPLLLLQRRIQMELEYVLIYLTLIGT